jgi:hypothetical protein
LKIKNIIYIFIDLRSKKMSITYESSNFHPKIEIGTRGLRITYYDHSGRPSDPRHLLFEKIISIGEITYDTPRQCYYFILKSSKLELPSEIKDYEISMNVNDHEKIQEVHKLITENFYFVKNNILGI